MSFVNTFSCVKLFLFSDLELIWIIFEIPIKIFFSNRDIFQNPYPIVFYSSNSYTILLLNPNFTIKPHFTAKNLNFFHVLRLKIANQKI